ncbi:patatin-like phospholipase domain-containing protein 7 [Capsaspora owczarzaki ATCC 30864]|uniref:Patatin-like phospholipase domain-containing protein 7 n=1 Tax=Capsaspora owczarzaki (strain ATCC 30864) TaxID=595528 RepID=A0A0D2WWB4_CAPO3|nr:patatin-like phospholipase domain-containing protein 7 [Capsaspora owczarzaki ATCC 30864]KJE96763.1 patatin-like phospholipase domain-containing protein 7 [Capsaspora owczarzaki ATCC 30864]|eukprot:XP_004343759.2 patatin-like phospholipase domain-containing protein 7 [Capsaspora owczarzaki ATCC 30864]
MFSFIQLGRTLQSRVGLGVTVCIAGVVIVAFVRQEIRLRRRRHARREKLTRLHRDAALDDLQLAAEDEDEEDDSIDVASELLAAAGHDDDDDDDDDDGLDNDDDAVAVAAGAGAAGAAVQVAGANSTAGPGTPVTLLSGTAGGTAVAADKYKAAAAAAAIATARTKKREERARRKASELLANNSANLKDNLASSATGTGATAGSDKHEHGQDAGDDALAGKHLGKLKHGKREAREGEDETAKLIRKIKILRYLDEPLARSLCTMMKPFSIKANELLFRKGDKSPDLWIVMEGTVQLFLEENDPTSLLCDIRSGQTVMSLLTYLDVMAGHESLPCQVYARASTDAKLLRLPCESFRMLASSAPHAVARITQMIMLRLQRITFLALYKFLGLTEELLLPTEDHVLNVSNAPEAAKETWSQMAVRLILARIGEIHQKDRELLEANLACMNVRKDQPLSEAMLLPPPDAPTVPGLVSAAAVPAPAAGSAIQFVVRGSVTLYTTQRNGTKHPLYDVGVGGIIGHLAALTGDHTDIFAIAKEDSQVVNVPRDVFDEIANNNPNVFLQLALFLSRRLSPLVRQFDYALDWRYRKAGKVLFEQGEECTGLHIVLHGRVRASHQPAPVAADRMGPNGRPMSAAYQAASTLSWTINGGQHATEEFGRGDSVGEIDLLTESRHSATVVAIRDTEICQIPKSMFTMIVNRYPYVMAHFARAMYKRIGSRLQRVARSPVFDDLLNFATLQPIGRDGPASGPADMDELTGASMTVQPSLSSTSLATTSTTASPNPVLAGTVPFATAAVAASAAHSNANRAKLATVALIASSDDVPLRAFANRLVACLSKLGQTLRLDHDAVLAQFNSKSVTVLDKIRLTSWLGRLEEENDIVVYEAENKASSWTKRCIRQADIIFVVCNGRNGPKIGAVEAEITPFMKRSNARKELVLLHDEVEAESDALLRKMLASRAGFVSEPDPALRDRQSHLRFTAPNGTRFWAAPRSWTNAHHHVCMHRHLILDTEHYKSDFARLARRVRGQSIGLVLGGGGAKGLSHVGIIKMLEEHEIPVDMVGGTSIGAFVGALYAKHRDASLLEEKTKLYCRLFGNKWRLIRDLTVPLTSFFSGDAFNRILRRIFGETLIEDFWLPYFCTTTNITTNSLNVHQEGTGWRYVRASMTLASFMPPLCEGNNLLLDGGYCNNLPADVMQALGAQNIIAVHVGTVDDTNYYNYGDALSGWWLLWRKINPFAKPVHVPSMSDISQRICYIRSDLNLELTKELYCSLYLRPPVNHYPLLAFGRYAEISAVGYEYAASLFKSWMASGQLEALSIPCKELVEAQREREKLARHQAAERPAGMLQRSSSFIFA